MCGVFIFCFSLYLTSTAAALTSGPEFNQSLPEDTLTCSMQTLTFATCSCSPPAPLPDHLPSIRLFFKESCPGPKSREDVGNRRYGLPDKHPRSEGWGATRMLSGSGSGATHAATKHCALGLHYALSPSRFLFQCMCQSYMFCSHGGVEHYKRRRQTELKHGRFSICETMLYVTPEITRKRQGYLSPSAGLKLVDVPNCGGKNGSDRYDLF